MEIVKLDVQILVEFVLLGKICRSSLSPAMIETDTSFWPSFLSRVHGGPFSGALEPGKGGGHKGQICQGPIRGETFWIFLLSLFSK
jgi:hypothetical protein